MDRKDEYEILRRGGFAEKEMLQLSRLRALHQEKERQQAAIAHRRLEFIRWLVARGKLTDQIA
ncbi:hypothetical protein EI42_04493 [Thermosporothrix hazakensis]|jgi:hypothetical protein|uniref:Uncharacterized protein n=2 Tax=Thermosporothrix TaxID=768650 RepID=A0A326U1P6_THEHA|nr:hypothetical protein [Thermosporothrix hazakensis]PZW24885.1 hypothetical protein EI42_04493 [Thermosporothrix hazakensis]BBH88241.1 hypothetical protein KTC_29920 [Thermosporothrix sp. COM3]GCE46426.1 hypothetical protein KTH_12950 [Thermosporothrix hazakensis]